MLTSGFTRFKAGIGLSLVALLGLTACSTAEGDEATGTVVGINAFSVMEAANEPVFADFEGTSSGEGVTFETSYGASGDQSRAVAAGADADVVH